MAKKYRARLMMNEAFFWFDAVIDRIFEADDEETATKKAYEITDDFLKTMKQHMAGSTWVSFPLKSRKLEIKIPQNAKYESVVLKNFEIYDKTRGPFLLFPPTGTYNMCNPVCIVKVTEDEFCSYLSQDVCESLTMSDYYRTHDCMTFESIAYGYEEVSD